MNGRRVVVHAVHSLDTGGLENGVVNLVNCETRYFQHVIVCMTTGGALQERLRGGAEVLTLGKRSGQDARALVQMVRVLRQLRPAIVHSRNWAALDAIPAARLAGVGVVVHSEHGREATDPDGRNSRRRRIRRLLSPLVSQFVTVSTDLERWLVEDVGLPRRKVLTIRNGVDLRRFSPGDRRAAREAFSLPEDSVVLGTVGRLDPVKDQASLLRAFAELLPAHPEMWLMVAGDGACRLELSRLADDLGISQRIRFLGERRDVPEVLAALDVFVLPSIGEGMSNTLLEAMAKGLPVVATRVGGNPELVEEGVNGRLVRAQDFRALAAAIAGYLNDPNVRAAHGKASRARVADRFSLERMTDSYVGLYDRLLARRGQSVA